jgi:hypothetical protein
LPLEVSFLIDLGQDKQVLIWNIHDYFNSRGKLEEESKSDSPELPTEKNEKVNRIQKSLMNYLEDAKKHRTPTLEA